MTQLQHPIQVVARLTGLSPHVIRVWEKRYAAVTPIRTGTNRRLYTEEQVDRLRLLGQATAAGHKISLIARLGLSDLQRLVSTMAEREPARRVETRPPWSPAEAGDRAAENSGRSSETDADSVERRPSRSGSEARGGEAAGGEGRDSDAGREGEGEVPPGHEQVQAALQAISDFDSEHLPRALEQGMARFGMSGLLRWVVGPLAYEIGDRWQRGEMTAAHEHFASAVIRDHLLRGVRPFALPDGAPRVVVATLSGQLHELGAVMAAAVAASQGWRPIYLGVSLPAAEIAGAAAQNHAAAVMLSLVYPPDDPLVPTELSRLRRLLPGGAEIIVGGRAAGAYETALAEIQAWVPDGLEELGRVLQSLRERRYAPRAR